VSWTERWKRWARSLKAELFAIYLAYRDPRVPWYARLVAACVVGYAFSPIDLIPDMIPILGYLDDLILLPLGIALTLRLIPPTVLAECRVKASEILSKNKPVNRLAAVLIVSIWLLAAGVVLMALQPR
jgi:uncharacterized membrane protein YkvA (DUF1232 family)